MKKSIQSAFLALVFLTVLLSGCAPSSTPVPPTATSTPIPPTLTPVPPTATSTPIPPTSTPAPIPGIDEPIVLENVTLKNPMGISLTADIQLRLLSADTKESLDSQLDSHLLPGNIFLILDLWLSGPLDWIVQNAMLTCGTDEYKVEGWGLEVGDEGKLKAWQLIFEVPQDSDFGQCIFYLKEHAVGLTTLFR